MTSKSRILLSLICVLALSGCVNREQADAKLAKACEAAVNVLLQDGQRIDKVKGSTATPSPKGPDFRHITLHTIMMDGWIEAENDYECVFQEGFGFLNSGYTASMSEVQVGDKIVGETGGKILGDVEDHMKVLDAVRKALYEN